MLILGGVSEAMDHGREDIVLTMSKRRGFVKYALQVREAAEAVSNLLNKMYRNSEVSALFRDFKNASITIYTLKTS